VADITKSERVAFTALRVACVANRHSAGTTRRLRKSVAKVPRPDRPRRDGLALALAGFNAGVEIGQPAVVLAVIPVIYLLRQARFYRPGVLVGGLTAIALVAGVWFVGRTFGFGLG